jgi:glycosyltransferase involved in cell wall biosynthesis
MAKSLKNKKIALLNTDDFTGGAAIACRRLLQALNRHTAAKATMLVQEKKSSLPDIEVLNHSVWSKRLNWLRFVLERAYFWFFEKDKSIRFLFNPGKFGQDITQHSKIKENDIIHLHWINFGFLSINSLEKLLKLDKPLVWTLHDMWAFTGGCHHSGSCEEYQKACGNCDKFLKNPQEYDLSFNILKDKKKIFFEKNITVVTCSKWLSERAKKSVLFANIRVENIPNPIDTEIFTDIPKADARRALGLDIEKQYILFAAMRIDAVGKGFSYFAKALKQYAQSAESATLNQTELLIFGQAQATDFDQLPFRVNMLGHLSRTEDIVHAYAAASVFVIPSLEENLPNTIMESLACGTPAVGFRVGGIPEMIDHQYNGYLAEYRSAEDLAAGIGFVLQHPQPEKLAAQARQKVLDNYAEAVVAQRYDDIYESLTQQK